MVFQAFVCLSKATAMSSALRTKSADAQRDLDMAPPCVDVTLLYMLECDDDYHTSG